MFREFEPYLPPRPGREVARVALPVGFEFVLILGLQFVNQVVVAGLGDTAVAAVGFANSIYTVPVFVIGALGVSASILVARAFGAKRDHELNAVVSVAVVVGLVVGVAVSVPLVLFPGELLTMAGCSPDLVKAGAPYLAIASSGLVASVLSFVFSGVLRSANHARSPMVATITTVLINTPLSIVLVYGLGPFPALGIAGAAWATLVTTVIKVIIMCVQTYGIFHVAAWELPRRAREWSALLGSHLRLAAPMGLTNLLWTSGAFFYNVVTAQVGDEALAAVQIEGTLTGVFIVGSLGLSSAITALVGRAVGAGNASEALAWTRYIARVGIFTGIVFAILAAVSVLALGFLYPNVTPTVVWYASVGLWVGAGLQPFIIRMLLYAAILPSGNDVRGILLGDFIGPFVFGIPVAAALSLLTPLGVYGIFVGIACEDMSKLFVFAWRARRLDWEAIVTKHQVENPLGDDPGEALLQAR